MNSRRLSSIDGFLAQVDLALKTITSDNPVHNRPSPAKNTSEEMLTSEEKRQSAALMRVNHAGEVCAQALYQGQALTAKLTTVRHEMEHAANEEVDHLAWCRERVVQLGEQPSILNPLWYAMSFGLGAITGLVSDKLSLGFVAATEHQVCEHLSTHLQKLPSNDTKSRAIVEKMLEDEARHADSALKAGGVVFPSPAKSIMTTASKAMTKISYFI
jgi:3-demethoxyubiquinol 3-hydroxylase